MKKVITYGTYDLLHYGHIELLKRAKKLGDYLIVGVTSDDFDKNRGKINVQQSLIERIEGVKSTGLADEIIIEEYEGQKIDDIKRYNIDIFTVGSDWEGKFDYLNEYCKVIYLERTKGVSSSEIRIKNSNLKIGLVGDSKIISKFYSECNYVNGVDVKCIFTKNKDFHKEYFSNLELYDDYNEFLNAVDAVYIASTPIEHYEHAKKAIKNKKHVLCESPITINADKTKELYDLARKENVILMDAIKTAYSTAYSRLNLIVKTGIIGDILSVDSVCTSIKHNPTKSTTSWNSICGWGPTALLPIFDILGVEYKNKNIVTKLNDNNKNIDLFTKIDFIYNKSVASIKVGKGIKSEGELIISGTKGYIYVPAPWWKTDYFEIRFEDQNMNKRYFYQLDGEGIRYEILAFCKNINLKKTTNNYVSEINSIKISKIIEEFYEENYTKI